MHGQFFQSVGIVSDSTSLDDFSLHIHYYEIMLVSRPIETNDKHSEILSILSYNLGNGRIIRQRHPYEGPVVTDGRLGISRLRMSGCGELPI